MTNLTRFQRLVIRIPSAREVLRIMALRESWLPPAVGDNMRCSVDRLFLDSKMSQRALGRGVRWLHWSNLVHRVNIGYGHWRRWDPFIALTKKGREVANSLQAPTDTQI